MDGLRQKLENQGLKDVVYMVINDHGEKAQRLHPLLAQRLSENIALYKQSEQQPDVWQTLNGKKDDFFIYDRCGRLTHHISLPYSVIGHGHVEHAIKDTYCNRKCGECSHENTEPAAECTNAAAPPDAVAIPPVGDNTEQVHVHHHGQHHHDRGHFHGLDHNHGHRHRHHDGVAHSSDHLQSQQHVRPQGNAQHEAGLSQTRHQLEADPMQQAVLTQQMLQEADGAPVRP